MSTYYRKHVQLPAFPDRVHSIVTIATTTTGGDPPDDSEDDGDDVPQNEKNGVKPCKTVRKRSETSRKQPENSRKRSENDQKRPNAEGILDIYLVRCRSGPTICHNLR